MIYIYVWYLSPSEGEEEFWISFHAIIFWQSVNALACKFSFCERNAATDFDRFSK